MIRTTAIWASIVVSTVVLSVPVSAQEAEPSRILFTNVSVFNGKDDGLADVDVLVEGNKIAQVAATISASEDMTVIDGGGRTMTPGFIDAHTHLFWNLGPFEHFYAAPDYQHALSLVEASNTLMRGFTTIRDVAGQVLGTKRAIDEGYFPGPRIYSAGAAISMTTGHGDFRTPTTAPRMMGGPSVTDAEHLGLVIFADGVPEVLSASHAVPQWRSLPQDVHRRRRFRDV